MLNGYREHLAGEHGCTTSSDRALYDLSAGAWMEDALARSLPLHGEKVPRKLQHESGKVQAMAATLQLTTVQSQHFANAW